MICFSCRCPALDYCRTIILLSLSLQTHVKVTALPQLGGRIDLLEGRKALKRNLNNLDQRAKASGMSFNKAKLKVLSLSHNNFVQKLNKQEEQLESC